MKNNRYVVEFTGGELVKLMKMVEKRVDWLCENEEKLKIERETIDWYMKMFNKMDSARDK